MQNETNVVYGFVHRPMSKYMQGKLTAQFCKRQASNLWGKKRIIQPQLLPFVWGDGKRIVAIRPIITRTHHFVVAVDSSIVHERDVHDIIDDIYEVHEEWFGRCECVECGGDEDTHDDGDIRFKQWPVICTNGGCEWWFLVR